MDSRLWIGGVVMGALVAGPGWAAEVNVSPGVDTLNAAIAAAADGDTLILETGTYSCSDAATNPFLVDKSLTIRANTNDADAMISCDFTIAGADIAVVVQGLDFSTNINVDQAADVKILQNTLYNGADINVTDYKTTEGDGTLTVVGNHLTHGGHIEAISSNDAYIAGNILDTGQIESWVPVWIVGNSITSYDFISPDSPILANPSFGHVQVLGNHVTLLGGGDHSGINIDASYALVAGNIVQLDHSDSSEGHYVYGITLSENTYGEIYNNVVQGDASGMTAANNQSAGINAGNSSRVRGNIVVNLYRKYYNAVRSVGGYVDASHNLCRSNFNQGGCGDSVVTDDPAFEAGYRLSEDSPAIDAGPEDFAFADLDRTRNDIGAYGGPWSIEQYDAQRDPLNYAPYVFQLFKANSAFTDGSIEVRALGVARLR